MAAIDAKLETMQLKMVAVEGKVDSINNSLTDLISLFRQDHDRLMGLVTRFETACGDIERMRDDKQNSSNTDSDNSKKIIKLESDAIVARKDIDDIKDDKTDANRISSSRLWNVVTLIISAILSAVVAFSVYVLKNDGGK